MDAVQLLGLLTDTETYKKRLSELQEQEKRVAEYVSAYTKLSKLDDYEKQANKRIEKANMDAVKILAEAEAAVEKAKATLAAQEEINRNLAEKNTKDLGEVIRRSRDNEKTSKELQDKAKVLEEYRKSLESRESILKEKEAEIDARLARLRSVMQ